MGTVPFFPDDPQGMSRRRWLELMGSSLALAGAAGCRWEKREIRPFAKRPADRVPGEPQKFATTMDLAGSALGLLVTCIDGRPIKVEGNPKHPSSNGATNAFAQAAILELYDPDRSKNIIDAQATGKRSAPGRSFPLSPANIWQSASAAARVCACFPKPALFADTRADARRVAQAVSQGEMALVRADPGKVYGVGLTPAKTIFMKGARSSVWTRIFWDRIPTR